MKKPRKIEEKCAKGYYEKDVYAQMEAMTDVEMIQLIKELEDTRFWIAISKYTMERIIVAQNSLNVLDPIKNGVDIARAQGILSGLMDLHSMAKATKETIKQQEKKANDKNDSTPDIKYPDGEDYKGGNYGSY